MPRVPATAYPDHYIQVSAYDASLRPADHRAELHRQPPADEPGFRLDRQEGADRRIRYTLQPYAASAQHGERYGRSGTAWAGRGRRGCQPAAGQAARVSRCRERSARATAGKARRVRRRIRRRRRDRAAGAASADADGRARRGAAGPAASPRMLDELDREFVGLAPVKDRVREIAALLLVDRLRRRYGPDARRARACTCALPAARAPARRRSPCTWASCCRRSSVTCARASWSA